MADDLDLAYNTVGHHLAGLEDNRIVIKGDVDYCTVSLSSDQARAHWGTVEEIILQIADDEEYTIATALQLDVRHE